MQNSDIKVSIPTYRRLRSNISLLKCQVAKYANSACFCYQGWSVVYVVVECVGFMRQHCLQSRYQCWNKKASHFVEVEIPMYDYNLCYFDLHSQVHHRRGNAWRRVLFNFNSFCNQSYYSLEIIQINI